MTATAAEIAKVRRMTAEATSATYTDAMIQEFIETYPLVDENGEAPKIKSTILPGVRMDNPDWTPTYDLNAAAADIWEEKAAVLAQDYDVQADGATLNRSQVYEQGMKQARYYRSRRSTRKIELIPDVARERTGEIMKADDE